MAWTGLDNQLASQALKVKLPSIAESPAVQEDGSEVQLSADTADAGWFTWLAASTQQLFEDAVVQKAASKPRVNTQLSTLSTAAGSSIASWAASWTGSSVAGQASDAEVGDDATPGEARQSSGLNVHYDVLAEVLGKGMSGDVHSGICKATGRRVAVKSYTKSGMKSDELERLREEVDLHKALSHSSLVELVDVYETEDEAHLVLEELAGGEVFDRIREKRRFEEFEAADVVSQVLSALGYLHSQKLAHRDVKPENLLYKCKNGRNVKLIDLGFTAKVGSDGLNFPCGSLGYAAPEVLSGPTKAYDERCDLWSTGSVLYLLLTGRHLLSGEQSEVYEKTANFTEPEFGSEFWSLSAEAQDLLRALLQADPEKRPSAKEALDHPWFAHVRDVKAKEVEKVALKVQSDVMKFALAGGAAGGLFAFG